MRNYLLLWDPFLDSTVHKLLCFHYTKCAHECADHKHVKNTFNAPSLPCRNSFRIWTKIIIVIITIKSRSDQTKRLQTKTKTHKSITTSLNIMEFIVHERGKTHGRKKEERNKSFTNNRNNVYARNGIHSCT